MGGEEALAKKVLREMHAIKGDAVAYTQILLNHYKASATLAQNKLVDEDVDLLLHNKVKAELERSRIKNYAVAINAAYQAAMAQRSTNLCMPRAFLVSDDLIPKHYDNLRSMERADLFSCVCAEKCVFHPDFWWNMVERPTKVTPN